MLYEPGRRHSGGLFFAHARKEFVKYLTSKLAWTCPGAGC